MCHKSAKRLYSVAQQCGLMDTNGTPVFDSLQLDARADLADVDLIRTLECLKHDISDSKFHDMVDDVIYFFCSVFPPFKGER